jgi:hypothetical protein
VRPSSAPADALTTLLAPYADPALPGRLLDLPPWPIAARALELLPADLAAARLNVQPPMICLVAQAADLHGRLVGSHTPGRALVVFDGIPVDAAAAASRRVVPTAAIGATVVPFVRGCPVVPCLPGLQAWPRDTSDRPTELGASGARVAPT